MTETSNHDMTIFAYFQLQETGVIRAGGLPFRYRCVAHHTVIGIHDWQTCRKQRAQALDTHPALIQNKAALEVHSIIFLVQVSTRIRLARKHDVT